MATNLIIRFRREADPTAATIIVDGTQIFSGVVGAGTTIGETFETDPLPVSLNPGQTASMSIAITSGILKCGGVYSDADDYPDFRVNNSELINGAPPEWPASPVDPMPGGTPENPDWNGWYQELGAGETFTCNITVPLPARSVWAPNTDYWAGQEVSYQTVVYTTNADCNSGATFNPAQFTQV